MSSQPLDEPKYESAIGAFSRRQKVLTNTWTLVGVVVFSVVLFILSFSTAASVVVTANLGFRGKDGYKKVAIFSACLFVLTVVLAIVFALTTKEWNLEIPLDTTALLSNLNLSIARRQTNDGKINVPLASVTPPPFSL
jgi:hypothetical protein